MQLITLYIITAVVFLGLDALMLTRVMRPLFEARLQDQLLADPRMGPAALFYLAYVAGLIWFVSWPALGQQSTLQALGNGAVLGFIAYGTYEFTNFATLRAWDLRMLATDLVWGTCLTGVSAAVGVWLVMRLFPA